MDFVEELDLAIEEMDARTDTVQMRMVCTPETLNELWMRTRMVYISADDVENGTDYAARYRGIPIILSSEAEAGKVFLFSDQDGYQPVTECRNGSLQARSPVSQASADGTAAEIDEDSFMNILKGDSKAGETEALR